MARNDLPGFDVKRPRLLYHYPPDLATFRRYIAFDCVSVLFQERRGRCGEHVRIIHKVLF